MEHAGCIPYSTLRMPRSRLMIVAAVVAAAGCADRPPAGVEQKALLDLAIDWSGGRSDPSCSKRGPAGEYLGTLPGAEHCQWPTVVRGSQWSRVGVHRDSLVGPTLLTWERLTSGDAAARALADSLGRAFVEQGYVERLCPGGLGRQWDGDGLVARFSRYPPRPDGSLMVTVFVTRVRSALPTLDCPLAPLQKKPVA
jgi:hypothetical protein